MCMVSLSERRDMIVHATLIFKHHCCRYATARSYRFGARRWRWIALPSKAHTTQWRKQSGNTLMGNRASTRLALVAHVTYCWRGHSRRDMTSTNIVCSSSRTREHCVSPSTQLQQCCMHCICSPSELAKGS